MKIVRRFLDWLYLFSGVAAGGFLLAIFVLMLMLSAGRPLGLNVRSGDDFIGWCMVAISFLGLAHTFRSAEMIRVGLLIDRFSGRTRWYFEIFSLVVGCFFTGYFAWFAYRMTYFSWLISEPSQGVIVVPIWIPQSGMAVGLVILFIAFVDELIHVLFGGKPHYEKPKPKTAEEAIEQAIQSPV
jgi:TRAP-type C4-dicarboxylate transport system permease small subunit